MLNKELDPRSSREYAMLAAIPLLQQRGLPPPLNMGVSQCVHVTTT